MKRENVNIGFESLLVRFWEGTISDEEMGLLQDMLAASPERMKEFKGLQALQLLLSRKAQPGKFDVQAALAKVKREIRRKRLRLVQRWAYAAGIALVMGLSGWLLWLQDRGMEAVGTNQTVVAKSYGEAGKVFLEVEENKQVELQPDTLKTVMGLYEEVSSKEGLPEVELEPQWRRLLTMEGATYSVILADGTKVWLNAETELTYPATFTGQRRQVLLKGEAYFEVAHDATRPFHVMANDMDIQVLGTSFNISAYPDSKRQTTLVEGQVSISLGGRHTILHPGEQATETPSGLEVRKVNVINYTSWRERRFIYEDKLLGEVMEDLGRWYNVNIFIANEEVYDYHLTANLPKYENMDKVLEIIEYAAGVQFEVNNRTVIVRADR